MAYTVCHAHLKCTISSISLIIWGGRVERWRWVSFQCPTNLGNSRARAYCACSRCGWGCLDIFFSRQSLLFLFFLSLSLSPCLPPSLSLSLSRRRSDISVLKYCLKGPLNPKQPTVTNNLSDACHTLYAMLHSKYK